MISILLLTLNGGDRLREALAAIRAQEGAEPFEILAIDSGSTDQTLATLHAFADRIHTIPPVAFGHGRTRNLAARLAQGEWLVFLSQDAVPAGPRWLATLTQGLTEPGVAAVFGRQVPPPDVGPIETFFLNYTYPPHPFEQSKLRRVQGGIGRIFFSNVNAAIRKAVLLEHPFPDDVIMSEDQAFGRAALEAGHIVRYEPEAAVQHGHRYSLSQLFRRNFDSGYSLREISGDPWRNVIALGAGYVRAEIIHLWRAGLALWIPYAVLYEVTKSAGFASGRLGHRLPLWLRRALSLHRRHWDAVPTRSTAP
ncbi:MAG: glycosyltransferase family 2 protein [Anaerolineales bacterium]|nr:glycosyltransferase family 2 protein [Anaerolineales bacterium]